MIFKFLILFTIYFNLNIFASDTVVDEFVKDYKTLKIASYELSHEKNIEMLTNMSENKAIEEKLSKLKDTSEKCIKSNECKLLTIEVKRIEARLSFAKELKENRISHLEELKKHPTLYKKSYQLALSEWTNDPNFSIEGISRFEKNEIKRIRSELKKLKGDRGEKTNSADVAEKYLKSINSKVKAKLNKVFTTSHIPEIKIKQNKNPNSQHIPGYYDSAEGIFYYTIPPGGVFLGDLDWLFLHEALPGHHMQVVLGKGSVATKLFNREYVYLDFIEGWAAYVETLGSELGVYKSSAAKRKALEWDLLRSTRVLIDIGLHLKGWTANKAKQEWKKLAPEVYHLAEREISRMQKWPAQVISYEYGKNENNRSKGAVL